MSTHANNPGYASGNYNGNDNYSVDRPSKVGTIYINRLNDKIEDEIKWCKMLRYQRFKCLKLRTTLASC